MMRLSDRTLQRYAEDGRGPPRIRLGARRVGYWKRDVERWLQERTDPRGSTEADPQQAA
jgi:predicted DNA-binding transcriptional regulator AlpA